MRYPAAFLQVDAGKAENRRRRPRAGQQARRLDEQMIAEQRDEAGRNVEQVGDDDPDVVVLTANPPGSRMRRECVTGAHRSAKGGHVTVRPHSRWSPAILGVLLLAGLTLSASPALAVEGGRPVRDVAAYPYVGLLTVPRADSDTLYELCTSVLVSPTWVLTAKHCLATHGYNTARDSISIRLNKISSSDVGVVQRDARELVPGDGVDLVLLRVDPVTEIQPIELVGQEENELFEDGTVATAVGWGGNQASTLEDPGTLYEGTQSIEDQTYWLAEFLSGFDHLMQTTPNNGDGRIRGGDSGGPLIVETAEPGQVRQVLVGVLSQGNDNTDDGIYTKVGSNYDWIVRTIGR